MSLQKYLTRAAIRLANVAILLMVWRLWSRRDHSADSG
jgi:hypothetical protein